MEDAAGYSMATTNMDVRRKGAIFVVADGVGGHQAGELASKRAVNAVLKEYYACPYDDTESSLRFAINQANDAIFKEAQETGKDTMATTLVCAVIREGILTLANVGDSRAYLLRNGKIRQLTEDHSWVNEQIRLGLLTQDDARENPYRNVITRSLGNKPKVEADLQTPGSLADNDLLILCSDGMYEGVDESTMLEVTRRLPSVQAAEELVDLAKRGGSTDNITVMIVEAHLTGEPEGVLVPMEVQRPAGQEVKTQPNPVVAEALEQMDHPVIKPDEPPANLLQDSPIATPILKEEITPDVEFDLENLRPQQAMADPDVINHQANGNQAATSIPAVLSTGSPSQTGTKVSQPSSVTSFRLPSEGEAHLDQADDEVSIHRPFYWQWTCEYRSSGTSEKFDSQKTLKLPDGSEITLLFRIIPEYFMNRLTKKTYHHPLAFEIGTRIQQTAKSQTKSKVIMGIGFYNQVRNSSSLNDLAKKNFEFIISEDEIFIINKTKPLIFATIELVEFENKRDHQAEQDFLTFLQIKARFHVIL